ncbi:MAG: cohesin domain-containing protein [Patescibacteria group bacterium]|nr:cohesin domain-containing protein [Patescibacteria group bacterium]
MIPQETKQNKFCVFLREVPRVFAILLGLLGGLSVQAAQLNLTSQFQEIAVGQQFQASIILDTGDEEINAVEGKIGFPQDLLELEEIRDGNSIINFWVERPQAGGDGEIIFSGITPGGFKGENNFILSLVFSAKGGGEGEIQVKDARILKNDGLGTSAEVSVGFLSFRIGEDAPAEIGEDKIKIRDYEPPETFRPEISRDELIFDGKWFLVFATQDKASGVDYYEVKEQRKIKLFRWRLGVWKKWQRAESPYILKDQKLQSHVYIKAVDKAGNERISSLSPRKPSVWYEVYYFYVIIIIAAGLIIAYIIWRKSRRKKYTENY